MVIASHFELDTYENMDFNRLHKDTLLTNLCECCVNKHLKTAEYSNCLLKLHNSFDKGISIENFYPNYNVIFPL